MLVNLIERGSGGSQLFLEGLVRGVGVCHHVVKLCMPLGEMSRSRSQLRSMPLLGILLRGFRGRQLLLERRARGSFLCDLLLQFSLAPGGDGLFDRGPLLVLPIRSFRVAKLLLERAASRTSLGQHRAKFRFAPGEALGCGGGF